MCPLVPLTHAAWLVTAPAPSSTAKVLFAGGLEDENWLGVGKCPGWLLPLSCQQDVLRCLNIDANIEEIVAFFRNGWRIYSVKHPRALCQHCLGHSCSSVIPAHGNRGGENHSSCACFSPESWKPSKGRLWVAQRGGFTEEKAFPCLRRDP